MGPTSEAVFDALHMAKRVDELDGGAKESEVHVLAYLACILFIFDGGSVASWGYVFSTTSTGAPYAGDLHDALSNLAASGHLQRDVDVYRPTQPGLDTHERLRAGWRLGERPRYLDAAANTGLALATPVATGAVMHEPQLRTAAGLARKRMLLDEAGLALLDPHFEGLRRISDENNTPDLFSTAVLWLRYLQADADQKSTDV